MKIIDKDKLSEYYLSVIEEKSENLDFLGWRSLGMIDCVASDASGLIRHVLNLETDSYAWVKKFMISILPYVSEEKSIVLVSPECPEIYFANRESILGAIEDCSTKIDMSLESLKQLFNGKWTPIDNGYLSDNLTNITWTGNDPFTFGNQNRILPLPSYIADNIDYGSTTRHNVSSTTIC